MDAIMRFAEVLKVVGFCLILGALALVVLQVRAK